MTTDAKTAEWMQWMIQGSERCFAEDGYLTPVFFLFSRDEAVPIFTPFRNERDKEKALLFVTSLVQAGNFEAIGHVAEVWRVQYVLPPDTPRAIARQMGKTVRPDVHADREEAVEITLELPDGTTLIRFAPILRDDGQPPRLGDWEEPLTAGTTETQGRFMNFFTKAMAQEAN